jgi:hypothetical protein
MKLDHLEETAAYHVGSRYFCSFTDHPTFTTDPMHLIFTPGPATVMMFPENLIGLAAKLAVRAWDEADRNMRVMRVQSQSDYLQRLRNSIDAAREKGETTIDGVGIADVNARWLRLRADLFWDEQLIVLNDYTEEKSHSTHSRDHG